MVLIQLSVGRPNTKNRVAPDMEGAGVDLTHEQPAGAKSGSPT